MYKTIELYEVGNCLLLYRYYHTIHTIIKYQISSYDVIMLASYDVIMLAHNRNW